MTRQGPGHHRLDQINAVTLGSRIGLKSKTGNQKNQESQEGHDR